MSGLVLVLELVEVVGVCFVDVLLGSLDVEFEVLDVELLVLVL